MEHKRAQHSCECKFWVRRESEAALTDLELQFFFPPQKPQKRISQLIFTGNMNFDNSDFSGKFVILFHNNMQAQYC